MEMKTETVKLPDQYINTGKATVLAIIKLLEALAGCFALYYVMMNPQAIQKTVQYFYEDLFIQADAQSAFYSIYNTLLYAIQYILVFELLLIVCDGIGSFFVRVAHKGAGLVKACHRIRYIFSIVGFVGCLYIIFKYIQVMVETIKATSQMDYKDIFSLLGSYELVLYVIMILGAFWIILDYDHYVAIIMKHVATEIKANEIQKMPKKNRLGRASAWFCGILTASVVLSAIELAGGESVLASFAGFITPIQLLYRGSNIISFAVAIALAIKFFLVNRCSADFDKLHK